MIRMTYAQFRNIGTGRIKAVLPIELTADGEPFAVVSKPEDVIVIKDMHPRVLHMLRAIELKARMGMPKIAVLTAEEVKESLGE